MAKIGDGCHCSLEIFISKLNDEIILCRSFPQNLSSGEHLQVSGAVAHMLGIRLDSCHDKFLFRNFFKIYHTWWPFDAIK